MNRTSISRTIIISIIFLLAGYFCIFGCSPSPEDSTFFSVNIPITANHGTVVFHTVAPGDRPLIITYYSDYRPLSWMDENGEMHGALVNILDEALNKRMGISVQHMGFPWIRAQEMVREGEADAFCSTPTEERSEYTVMSKEIIFENKISLFVNLESPYMDKMKQIGSLQDLSPYKMSNYFGNGWASQRLSGMDVTWVTTPEQALRMVDSGRSDAYIDSSAVTNDTIRRMGLKNLVEIPVTFDTGNFYFFIGNNSSYIRILPEFDATIKEMKVSGDLQTILEQYITQ